MTRPADTYPAPGVWRHPNRMSGKPCVVGTRIPTASIGSLDARGLSAERIVGLWPDQLTVEIVRQVLSFERGLELARLRRRLPTLERKVRRAAEARRALPKGTHRNRTRVADSTLCTARKQLRDATARIEELEHEVRS
jgi:uncharacterized protein (DUF433 family)